MAEAGAVAVVGVEVPVAVALDVEVVAWRFDSDAGIAAAGTVGSDRCDIEIEHLPVTKHFESDHPVGESA